jgi:elongation factor 1-gamma
LHTTSSPTKSLTPSPYVRYFVLRYQADKQAYTAAVDKLQSRLQTLDKILLDRTYIVGERITLADVFIATALANAFSGHVHAELRKQTPNVVRYFNT